MTREDIEGRDQETDDDAEINPPASPKRNRWVSSVRPLSVQLIPFRRQSNSGPNAEFQPS